MKQREQVIFLRTLFYLVALVFVSRPVLSAKPCGTFNLIDGVMSLNQTDFIRAKNDFGTQNNGKAMSVFGWIQLNSTAAAQHSILRLSLIPNQSNETAPATFPDFAKIVYDTSNATTPLITLTNAYDDKKVKTESFAFTLPVKTWLFMTYTFDYAQGIVGLHFRGKNETSNDVISFYGEMKVAFGAFYIPQKMEMDIGCFPKAVYTPKEKEEILKTCMNGSIRDFSLILEYSKNPSFGYMIKTPNHQSSVLFKLTDNKGRVIIAPTIPDAQGSNATLALKTSHFDGSSNATVYELPNLGAMSIDDFHTAVTIYTELAFSDQVPDNFLILAQRQKPEDKVNHMEMRLMKDSSNKAMRRLQISFPHAPTLNVTSDSVLAAEKTHKIILGFSVYNGRNVAVIVNIDGASKLFEGIAPKTFTNGLMYLSGSNILTIYTFALIPNAASVSYSAVIDPVSWKASPCFNNCELSATTNFGAANCLSCNSRSVNYESKCLSVCPRNTLGVKGTCSKCEKLNCSQLDLSRFFAIVKVSPTAFTIIPAKTLANFNNTYESLVIATIAGAKRGVDYNITITPEANSATYVFSFAPNRTWTNSSIIFSANPETVVNDNNYTLVQGADIEIPYSAAFDNSKNLPAPAAPQASAGEEPAPFKDEFVNENIEAIVANLALAAFIIFLFGMLLGVINTLIRCRSVAPSPFFYQKFIQSFLMFYYITFWLFYNSQLPRNLLSFLRSLYFYSVGFHHVFNDVTLSQFGDDPNFKSYLQQPGSWRFAREHVPNSFVLNFALIFIIQAAIIAVYLIAKLALVLQTRRRRNVYQTVEQEGLAECPHIVPNAQMTNEADRSAGVLQRFVQMFEWKLLFTLFAIFVIETTVFALHNALHYSFAHTFWTFSFAWSIVYLSLVGFLVLAVLVISLLPPTTLHVETFSQRFGFIYEGLGKAPFRRCFQGIQYVHYLSFSAFLVAAFSQRYVQIIPNLVFMSLMMIMSFTLYPAQKFDKIEQIVVQVLLWIAKLFLSAIVIDDTALIMNGEVRWIFGYVALIIAFIVITWNTAVIAYKFVCYWIDCRRVGRQVFMDIPVQVHAGDEQKSMKYSLPPAMQADVDGSNRIIGFDEDKNQVYLTSRNDIVSGMNINAFSKKTIQMDKYISNPESNREFLDNKSQVGKSSRVFVGANDKFAPVSKGEIVNVYHNEGADVTEGSIHHDIMASQVQPFSQRSHLQNAPDFQGKTGSAINPLKESQAPMGGNVSQKGVDIDARLQSLKNLGSSRHNISVSQPPEQNSSINHSQAQYQPFDMGSKQDLQNAEGFAKKKESQLSEQPKAEHTAVIEENVKYDSFFEQSKKNSAKNFFEYNP